MQGCRPDKRATALRSVRSLVTSGGDPDSDRFLSTLGAHTGLRGIYEYQ